MLNRAAQLYLTEWSSRANRKPLIIRGARQVGKTRLVEYWASLNNLVLLKIDFEKEAELAARFKRGASVRALLEELFLLKKTPVDFDRTVLFLDEIQAFPEALSLLRYFYEDFPKLRVIATGSLLDFALADYKHAMPVGRVEYLFLKPLSFLEFLEASEGRELVDYLMKVDFSSDVTSPVITKIKNACRNYIFVGGMPEAVQSYVSGQGLSEVSRIQAGLLLSMQDDFAKFQRGVDISLLRTTYLYIARNIGRKIKYVNISPDHRSTAVKLALSQLKKSRIVTLVTKSHANGIPLGAEEDESFVKGYFLDIGLANHILGLPPLDLKDLLTVNEGQLAEQFVAQELLAYSTPYEDFQLHYWAREAKNSNAEIDFVIQSDKEIVPIEVKSGKIGTLKSLHQFIQEKKNNLAIRVYAGDLAKTNLAYSGKGTNKVAHTTLLSLPLCLVFQWKKFT